MKRATTSLRFLPALLAVLISVSSAGCGSDEQEVEALAERFAVMESRAIDLRERRFELADAIRFATDTLLGSADSIEKYLVPHDADSKTSLGAGCPTRRARLLLISRAFSAPFQ